MLSFRLTPNSAAGVTRVHRSTDVSGLVTVEPLDVSGRATRNVLTEHVNAGHRVVELGCVGHPPVGVYFATPQAPEGSRRTSWAVVLE